MKNQDATLDALTNQRVSVTVGGKFYSLRKATLYDIGLINKFRKEKEQSGDDANLDLDAELYIFTELMKPVVDISPEQFAKAVPFNCFVEINEALIAAGFTVPQL